MIKKSEPCESTGSIMGSN